MDAQKKVLAIHDISCMGRCSLTVALPILSAAGIYTGVLPTALLSTHTGDFAGYTYEDLTPEMPSILRHWDSLGLSFDGIYSGFLGSYEQIDLVRGIIENFRAPGAIAMVDPAMADHGRLYATYTPEMASGMKGLCASADIIVPNLTEAALLLDMPYPSQGLSPAETEDVLKGLAAMGPGQVVLTGVSLSESEVGAACYDSESNTIFMAMGPHYEGSFHGTGDVFASALMGGLTNGMALAEATQLAVDFTYHAIDYTIASGQERRFGVRFEAALPLLIKKIFGDTH